MAVTGAVLSARRAATAANELYLGAPDVVRAYEKMATVQRAEWRKAQALKVAELRAEEAYRAAVADMAAALAGANVEAARAAVRSLTGDIPVFEKDGTHG